jgi:hypothetical protein
MDREPAENKKGRAMIRGPSSVETLISLISR